MRPGWVVQILGILEIGQQFIQLSVVYQLVVVGRVIPFLPGQLTDVSALVVHVVVVPTEQFRVPIGGLHRATHGSQCGIIRGMAVVLGFVQQFLPPGLHDPGLPKVHSFVPMVKPSQLVCHYEAFLHQDSPVAFPSSIALEGIDVVAKHEHDEISECFFRTTSGHPDAYQTLWPSCSGNSTLPHVIAGHFRTLASLRF